MLLFCSGAKFLNWEYSVGLASIVVTVSCYMASTFFDRLLDRLSVLFDTTDRGYYLALALSPLSLADIWRVGESSSSAGSLTLLKPLIGIEVVIISV